LGVAWDIRLRARMAACADGGEFIGDVREVMASLEPKDAEAPVINALRKEVDKRQVEFLKSGKLSRWRFQPAL